jgi:hypothetical protein
MNGEPVHEQGSRFMNGHYSPTGQSRLHRHDAATAPLPLPPRLPPRHRSRRLEPPPPPSPPPSPRTADATTSASVSARRCRCRTSPPPPHSPPRPLSRCRAATSAASGCRLVAAPHRFSCIRIDREMRKYYTSNVLAFMAYPSSWSGRMLVGSSAYGWMCGGARRS